MGAVNQRTVLSVGGAVDRWAVDRRTVLPVGGAVDRWVVVLSIDGAVAVAAAVLSVLSVFRETPHNPKTAKR